MTAPATIRLSDHRPPAWLVEEIRLEVELLGEEARVLSRARYRRNPEAAEPGAPLRLDGDPAALRALRLDGRSLGEGDYETGEESLVVPAAATLEGFELEVETALRPADNKSLEGLYRSGGTYCTQCEAEGFRKITFFPDRPDVMTVYTTRIVADRASCPVLLSNGNLVESGELEGGRHFAVWHDPFPKPSYLYALVAGDLGLVKDSFTTASGREVELRVYVDRGAEDRVDHALSSLKRAMRWDEEVYGREYDLDLFMIVAVHDFNFGAMENKGLNVFNSALVLARPETATDTDFQRIEGVVAHEYFHNWSGNRVTLRDWFQLSLKEGFTVFRDQSFSADMNSPEVQRIDEVRHLRAAQFAEDAGPTAHAVRPETYITIDNFYTVTVYEKGAEVVRMIHALIGPEAFRRGSDLYFERHDGEAVTIEDFVRAMEEASGRSLERFRRWYSQAGTPVLEVSEAHDAARGTYELRLRQRTPPTPGQKEKLPLQIPLRLGLVGPDGRDLPLHLEDEGGGEGEAGATERVFELVEEERLLRFTGVAERPRASLLRGFSAPVKLVFEQSDEDLAFLLAHDADGFNRWDAGQRLAQRILLADVATIAKGGEPELPELYSEAFGRLLADESLDPALAAEALLLPSESWLGDLMEVVDVEAVHAARRRMRRALALRHRAALVAVRERLRDEGPHEIDAAAMGRRALSNVALGYLAALDDAAIHEELHAGLEGARCMTDELTALALLADSSSPRREEALAAFRERWKDDTLVVNKWLAVRGGADRPGILAEVEALREDPLFDENNPNRVRALYGAFARNLVHFHARDGRGYRFLADRALEIDSRNPQLASQLLRQLASWRRHDAQRGALMKAELARVLERKELSRNSFEIASKSL